MTIALGLDVSATATGIVVLEGLTKLQTVPTLMKEAVFKPKSKSFERFSDVAGTIMDVVQLYRPDIIAIEGFALGKFSGAAIVTVGVGTVVRYFLYQHERRYLEPSPTQVKQFVSGKGNSKKEHMMMEVLDRWGHKSLDNNAADAYGLAAMGLAWSGKLKMTGDMAKIIGTLKLS